MGCLFGEFLAIFDGELSGKHMDGILGAFLVFRFLGETMSKEAFSVGVE